jgi:hypothetical protein
MLVQNSGQRTNRIQIDFFYDVWLEKFSVLIACVLVFTVPSFVYFVLFVFFFMYIFYLTCLYQCKDYCHRVTAVCTSVRTTATE